MLKNEKKKLYEETIIKDYNFLKKESIFFLIIHRLFIDCMRAN